MGLTAIHSLALAWPIRLEYFSGWTALGLFVVASLPFVLLGMRSLSGLGAVRKWVAIGVRILVVGAIILILGGIRWQREHEVLEVMVLKDISQSTLNVREYPGAEKGEALQGALDDYLTAASADELKVKKKDRIGVISFHSDALIDALPNERLLLEAKARRDPGSGTDVASAIQLALASLSQDAMHRLLLIWDGNMTAGDLDSALGAAASAQVPIDVLPLRYAVESEVMVDRFVAPTWMSEQAAFSLEIVLRSTNTQPVTGELTVYHQNLPMDLDPYTEGAQTTRKVILKPGTQVERVAVGAQSQAGVHQFRAEFKAPNVEIGIGGQKLRGTGGQGTPGDTLLQNNSATAFTFVRGKGKVLYIDNTVDGQGDLLAAALTREGVNLDQERRSVDQFPNDIVTLQNYDAIVLANVPRGAGGLSDAQADLLTGYVHDMGGGLLMIGGPDAFGAGGWQGSTLEKILPVDMDIPAQRQIAKGALALIMHSCEFDNGNYWGEQCAIKAIEAVSERDEVGIISYGWGGAGGGGSVWDFPLQEKGDGSKAIAAAKNMKLGDMPSFDDSLNLALNGDNQGNGGLLQSSARQKHIIIISDGDPARPSQNLIDLCIKNKITVSTVSVFPHGGIVPPTMKDIADATKGKFYGPINENFNQLPQIFIKEATVVRRSLIFEPKPPEPLISPLRTPAAGDSDMVAGIDAFPQLYGMVLTTRKPSPEVKVPLVAGRSIAVPGGAEGEIVPGKIAPRANPDPILAHWQTGLGRSAVFTSDAHSRWSAQWVNSSVYDKFWSQTVRALARPPMSSDLDVQLVQAGDSAKVIVEASNREGGYINFLNVKGQVVGPDMKPVDVRLVQTGPGTYEGEIATREPGNYVVVLNYTGPNGVAGWFPAGLAVNTSPELRDLRSNDAMIERITQRTAGRVLPSWDPATADLFNREGVKQTASPLPVWDLLLPVVLGLFLVDVATRRIAWDWASVVRMYGVGVDYIRSFTTTRKVETRGGVEALKKVRSGGTAKPQAGEGTSSASPRADASAKFEAREDARVEGDITSVVGGAKDAPIPKAPPIKEPPKGERGDADTMGGLMAAKRRAQKKIQEKQSGEGG